MLNEKVSGKLHITFRSGIKEMSLVCRK